VGSRQWSQTVTRLRAGSCAKSLLVLAFAALGSRAKAPGATVPLATGLVFTTTSHAGLVANARSVPVADTETVYAVMASEAERVSYRFSVSAPADSAAGRLLEGQVRSFDRTVRREDLRSAARLSVLLSSTDPISIPGQTFTSTSSAVLQALHGAAPVAFVLGVNEPEQGLQALAGMPGTAQSASRAAGNDAILSTVSTMLTSMSVSRHYYRGTLQRIGATAEPFSVLIDGRRTNVPAIHVRGTLTFADRTIEPQIWWLDDPENPLTLKWAIGDVYEIVTRIDRAELPRVRTDVAQALTKSCRAELSGIYFTTASAQVLDASLPALGQFAALMREHADWNVTIEGHTDNIGSADYNLDLSARRAAAVRDVLVRRFEIRSERLQTKGYGLTRPVETNATDAGRAHNRRVEVSRRCAPEP
jgi:outer membrane protein OmpA-like peptidoglycan-associated protein